MVANFLLLRTWQFFASYLPLFARFAHAFSGCLNFSLAKPAPKPNAQALLQIKEMSAAAEKLKTDFIQNMQHDIRTPFNGIYGMAEFLAMQETDPCKKEFLTDIMKSAKELLDYSTSIFEYSKIEAGAIPSTLSKINLPELIESVVAMEKPPAKIKKLQLLIDYADVPRVIISDRYRLQRILINVVSNAIKFTEHGFVKLSAKLVRKKDPRHVIISFAITDSGIGIPRDQHELIFTRFVRLTPAHSSPYRGQGLGLTIVKQFVAELEGELEIKSWPGQGTTLVISLPVRLPLVDN